MKYFLFSLIAVTFLLSGCVSTNNSQMQFSITLLEFGAFSAKEVDLIEAKKTTSGEFHVISEVRFSENVDTIKAKAGTGFGIRYVVSGKEASKEIPLTVRVRHPEFYKEGKSLLVEEWISKRFPNVPMTDGYIFDYEYELVEGQWTIELWFKNKKYIEKSFTITKDI